MKWEPVNANKAMNEKTVLCFVEVQFGQNTLTNIDLCEVENGTLIPLTTEMYVDCDYAEVTHFMVVEEPNNENTNQAS